jgi:5'(3')-deoxyribonucleotidase
MKIIFIDLDGVVADFEKGRVVHPMSTVSPYIGRPDKLPGLYENLEPIPNSIESVNQLLLNPDFDVYFLSTAPWDNPEAWMHKRLWVAKYFDEKLIRKRLILSHHKQLLMGDFLIDDRRFNGASEFQGKWIHFGSELFPDWISVLNYLNKLNK